MADCPARVRVGPHVYRVVVDEARIRQFEHDQGGKSHKGYTDRWTCEIVLDPRQAPCQLRETLWHEIKHAVASLSRFDQDEEEDMIARMAPWELLVLRDNPTLVAFLLEGDDAAA